MKTLLLAIFLLGSGIAQAQQKSTIVVTTNPDNEVSYWSVGMGDINSFALGVKGKADSNGCYVHGYEVSKPSAIRVLSKGVGSFTLYLTPGSKDTITVSKDTLLFSGTNAAYNRCLRAVDDYQAYCDEVSYRGAHELRNVSSFEVFTTISDARKNKVIESIKSFELPVAFVEEQLMHVDYAYRSLFFQVVLHQVKDFSDDWKTALLGVLALPWDSPYLRNYRGVRSLCQDLSVVRFLKIEKGNPRVITDPLKFQFDCFRQYFKGENLLHAWATFIYEDISAQEHSPAILPLYEELKDSFPNNHYLAILQPGIDKNARSNSFVLNPKDYHIRQCDSTITCLEEAVKPFKGKVVYIDVWATWCGSCKTMFQYVPTFKEKAKGLDIVYLYISIDRPQEKEAWEKAITRYQLKGHHMLASKELGKSLYKELGNERRVLSIPNFVIINKEGKIVERHACTPDEPEALLKQLSQYAH